jgi:hypothetical protein
MDLRRSSVRGARVQDLAQPDDGQAGMCRQPTQRVGDFRDDTGDSKPPDARLPSGIVTGRRLSWPFHGAKLSACPPVGHDGVSTLEGRSRSSSVLACSSTRWARGGMKTSRCSSSCCTRLSPSPSSSFWSCDGLGDPQSRLILQRGARNHSALRRQGRTHLTKAEVPAESRAPTPSFDSAGTSRQDLLPGDQARQSSARRRPLGAVTLRRDLRVVTVSCWLMRPLIPGAISPADMSRCRWCSLAEL